MYQGKIFLIHNMQIPSYGTKLPVHLYDIMVYYENLWRLCWGPAGLLPRAKSDLAQTRKISLFSF